MTESMQFTGTNGAPLRDWVNRHAPEGVTYFVTRGMAASTGQTWPYLRALGGWGNDVVAGIFDPVSEEWKPVRGGDFVALTNAGGFEVRVLRRD